MTNTNNTLDFDLFLQEQKEEKKELKIFGEVIEMPAQLPAILMVEMYRASKKGGEMSDEKAFDMIENILGKENFEWILSKGLGLEHLMALITKITAMYTGLDDEELEKLSKQKAKAPSKRR
jgi:hypothetical protein